MVEHNIWLKMHCTGNKPSSRDGHACTSIGPNMFIHGGFDASVRDHNTRVHTYTHTSGCPQNNEVE